MLKLPKGLKKKKKKSKKDQELFTEEELKQYKRDLKAKQEVAAAKSDAGESEATSDVEGVAASVSGQPEAFEISSSPPSKTESNTNKSSSNTKSDKDEEWEKFKALTSGVDSILHKTQDELDRIKKESFYQRLPSAVEKKKLEEEEAAKREVERVEAEKRKAAEREAQRDKLAEAVVALSDSEEDDFNEFDDIFATDYIEAITSGEVKLAVVPDSPLKEFEGGPDPFDTSYAEKVIVGADKVKGNKKLVSLGAAVEVLSGRVDREHAVALAKPKRKQRKGIQNLLLSESVDLADGDLELTAPEPQKNILDELVSDVPEPEAPIDLSVSLHLHLIQPIKQKIDEDETPDIKEEVNLSEFDTLITQEDDEFAVLAAESLTKKAEGRIVTEITLPKVEELTSLTDAPWAEFSSEVEDTSSGVKKAKPARPPPPARPTTGPHIVEGAIYIIDDEDFDTGDDPFNTTYAEQVIKKTTELEEDDDFDPRAEEKSSRLQTQNSEFYDPIDATSVSTGADTIFRTNPCKTDSKESLTDSGVTLGERTAVVENFDNSRRKSSLSLNLQSKTVGFLVADRDLLGATGENCGNKKPLTPFYVPKAEVIFEKVSEDPFDTSFVPDVKPTEVELKNLEKDLLQKTILKKSLSDPDFDPRAPPTPEQAEDLLFVKENINIKVLTPAQESKDLEDDSLRFVDPFDTSIASNLQPGAAELKVIENELLKPTKPFSTPGVLDTETDAQELGLGDKVLTPSLPTNSFSITGDIDPFDTSIASNLAPGKIEIKLLESELIDH